LSLSLKNCWDRISENYQQKSGIPTDDVYWGDFVATESQLKILGDVRRKRILEIGCGGAQNSIALSKWGAKTLGVDLSRKQILYGRRLMRNESVQVSLLVCNMERLEENMLHPLDKEKIWKIREARQQHRIMNEVPYWIVFKARKTA
jgi:2-polyprenyl-3-methyl-5-hydroxy-6-metoxy-1,4-benzoquinol methylase